jgi:DNA-binding NarL/FixJ family response regulator
VATGNGLLPPAGATRVIREFARARRPQPPPAFDNLTERERDVFHPLARGLSNAEIASQLFVTTPRGAHFTSSL